MNLRALRLFVVTAEVGGIGRASERLHLSQPAASRQLQALESELGIALFARIGRRLRLTPDGEDMLRHARQLLTGADLIADRARALKGGQVGTLKVGATPHVIAGVLAPFLRQYCSRYPGIEVQIVEGGAASQPSRLDSGDIHLAIMPVGDDRFDGRLLYPVHAIAAMADTYRFGRRAVLDVAELRDEPLLVLRREFGSHTWFYAATEIAHFKPRVRLESSAPETLVELAVARYGIAILPSTVAIRVKGLRVLPLVQRGESLGRWSMLAWEAERKLPPYADHFVEELCAHGRAARPGREFLMRAPPIPPPKRPKA